MTNFIDLVEEHTNNECTEQAAEFSLISLVITGIVFCIGILL